MRRWSTRAAYHERAAGRAIAPLLGDDPARLDEFSTWLKADKVRFESALSDLVDQRNPGKLVQAAADFKRRSPGDLSAYTKAGFEVSIGARRDPAPQPEWPTGSGSTRP